VVGAVLERSAAARAGLAVGDRILAVNGVATDSAEAVRRELREARLRETLRLRVERRGEPHDLALPPVERALPSQ
jgi:S1-C subfamily serine protease